MKTIKQLAEEIGVSKQAVNEKITKLELTSTLQKIGNRFAIDEEQETLIKQAFEEKSTSEKSNDLAKKSTSTLDEIGDFIKILQEQLEVKDGQLRAKDEQLAEKDKQIEKLTDTIKAQAQSINADRHNELAGTLQMQLTDSETTKPISRWKRAWTAWKGE